MHTKTIHFIVVMLQGEGKTHPQETKDKAKRKAGKNQLRKIEASFRRKKTRIPAASRRYGMPIR